MPHLLKMLRYFLVGSAQRIFGLQILIALALCVGGRYLWKTFEKNIREQPVYLIDKSAIRVFNPPIWVSNRFIQEALDCRPPEIRDRPLNSLDANLPQELLTAFSQHPWVEKVEKIVVYYPGKIDVVLQFKTPVAVVDPTQSVAGSFGRETAGAPDKNGAANDGFADVEGFAETENDFGTVEKYVVDANGYRLPDAYFRENPNAYYDFLWILGAHSTPMSGYGQCVDPLVVEAASFAEFLLQNDVPKKLGINRIVVARDRGATNGFYQLKTASDKNVVRWGRFVAEKTASPQETALGAPETPKLDREEEKARVFCYQKRKLERLFEVAQKYRSIDDVPQENAAELDLSQYL